MISKSTGSLVFIDSNLEQYDHLLNGVIAGTEVVVLDAQRDGVEQITRALQARRDVQAVHVLSHAAPGVLNLGSAQITPASISYYARSIQQWAQALAANAEILLYGCKFAANEAGRSLVNRLSQLTQAAIAASDTLTGAAHLGGDWNLSVQTAPMRAALALQPETLQTYGAVLAVFDWSSPEIDWPDGRVGTTTFKNVDGTGVDFRINIAATEGVTFGRAPSQTGPLTPDDITFLQGGEVTVPTALHITMDNETTKDNVTATVSFSTPLRKIAFRVFDVDVAVDQNWQDEVKIIGFRGNKEVQPRLIAADNASYVIDGNVATGVRNASNTGGNSAEGMLSVAFDSRITSYQVTYRSGPDAGRDPGEQGIAILSNIFFRVPQPDPPDTDDLRLGVKPGETRQIIGLAGTDSNANGTVERFRITSLPAKQQGTLFLGDPARGGKALEVGDRVRADRINHVFFQASSTFSGTTFEYAAIDNDGLEDPTPGVVRLRPRGTTQNQRPETDDVRNRVDPDSVKRLQRLGGADPDGTVEAFQIVSLPPEGQGTLFLGNPKRNGVAVEEGQDIAADQINQLFFQSTTGFTGTSFEYAAIDDQGAIDRSPGTVNLRPGTVQPNNRPPDTVSFSTPSIPPEAVVRLNGFEVTDPNGNDTVESFTILRLPPKRFATLFIGNPDRGGTPVVAGEPISIDNINNIFLSTTADFLIDDAGGDNSIRFRYTATDTQGASDRTPARVLITPTGAPPTRCLPGETLIGTRRDDQITGTINSDRIFGRNGNDLLRGRGCPDVIDGGQGDDVISGGGDNDTLRGGAGDDAISGGTENDLILGGFGDGRLDGGTGNDIIRGGTGSDRISGGDGNDQLRGKGGDDDRILGNAGNDEIFGGRGNDQLQGGKGNDRIFGRSKNDRIRGDKGRDLLNGGLGSDIISGRIGRDRIIGGAGNDLLNGDSGADRIRGELGDDVINGNNASDRLRGNEGNDRIRAGRGADIANGGRDDDFLSGRNGSDRLRGASGDDRLRGTEGNDLLIGNRGSDRLNAGTGNNVLIGGLGEDVLVSGRSSDQFVYRTMRDGGESGDRILRFRIGRDRINLREFLSARKFSADTPFQSYVNLSQFGSNNTRVEVNVAGDTGEDFRTFAVLRGIDPSDVARSSFII